MVSQSGRVAATVQSATELIGNTPLVKLNKIPQSFGIECDVYAKVELFNAGGSVKDRIALRMIEEAEKSGRIKPGDTLIEPTSGNTGIGLALVGAIKGYKTIITLPEKMSAEKVSVLRALGATIIRTPTQAAWDAPESHIGVARRLEKEIPNAHILDQYGNLDNPLAHEFGTAEEIWEQTGGRISAIVAGAGTGGTISGVAKYLKEEQKMSPRLRVVLADPQGSGLFNRIKHGVMYSPTEREGTRRRQQVDSIVEGVGINRVTENLEAGRDLIDDAVRVTDEQACRMARWLVEHDGIFVGSSSAVNCTAAVVAAMALPPGSQVVTILCDPGTRHLSKFWKRIKDMGLEQSADTVPDLFAELGIPKTE
jgi:cystathionine beta-synthase